MMEWWMWAALASYGMAAGVAARRTRSGVCAVFAAFAVTIAAMDAALATARLAFGSQALIVAALSVLALRHFWFMAVEALAQRILGAGGEA